MKKIAIILKLISVVLNAMLVGALLFQILDRRDSDKEYYKI